MVPLVFEARIASGLHDAEDAASGAMYSDSSELELIDDPTFNGDGQTAGLRFTRLDILTGTVITAAYLQFQADEPDSSATNLTIRAEASDDARAFLITCAGERSAGHQCTRALSIKSESILFLDWRVRSVAEKGAAQC